MPRVAGALLLVAGAYVAWYGAWELRVLGGGDPGDPVIEAAARIQRAPLGVGRRPHAVSASTVSSTTSHAASKTPSTLHRTTQAMSGSGR